MEYFEFSADASYAVSAESLPVQFHDGQPVPVESRTRLGYGHTSEDYLNSGQRDVRLMLGILDRCGAKMAEHPRCLDFGCGGGRMLRHLPTALPGSDCWGCDTESRAIAWAQTFLSSELRLFTNLREPHLPFEDGHFDFIYAGSVFSHLNDMAEFWMLELRRITKPGSGLLYLTFQDDHSLAHIRKQGTEAASRYYKILFERSETEKLLSSDYRRVVIGRDKYSSQVFYKTARLQALLEQFFSHVELVPHGYGWQTAAILRKSA